MEAIKSGRSAAEYVRMSTDNKTYSIEMQRAALASYAKAHGYQIVKTYEDPGVSGLTLKNRPGLKAMLADVVGVDPGFSTILVYDISRWGRFQDVDQSAHYEFICRDAGISVEYCAEIFLNDGSLTAAVLKVIKRAMAAEFSRELSSKIRAAHRGLRAKGFWTCGPAPYGYRRVSISPKGVRRTQMERGQRNAIKGDRMTLEVGPPSEVAILRRIFTTSARGASRTKVALQLNNEGVPSPTGGQWDGRTIGSIIHNEVYVGIGVSGRTTATLGVVTRQPPKTWQRLKGAFPAIVSQTLFRDATRTLAERQRRRSTRGTSVTR